MTTPHPYAEALEWVIEGKFEQIEARAISPIASDEPPELVSESLPLMVDLLKGCKGYEFSLRPEPKKYKMVNGVRVPMHEEVEPDLETAYWAPSCIAPHIPPEGYSWCGTTTDKAWLDAGFIYRNPADAAACGMAMRRWEACE